MLKERKELLTAVCTVFRNMEEASSPTDPAVMQAKRSILNGLAEMHMIDALDDARYTCGSDRAAAQVAP